MSLLFSNQTLNKKLRTISSLSIPAKCQERIVHNAIYSHVAPYLTKWQHGFVRGRSFTTQLVLSHHQWSKALDEGRQVDVIFLDFAKAFDRVAHDVLLQKLCNLGISGALLKWCQDYLTNREPWLTEWILLGALSCQVYLRAQYLAPCFCNFYQRPARSCYPRK